MVGQRIVRALLLFFAWGGVGTACAQMVSGHERAITTDSLLSRMVGGKKAVVLRPGQDVTNVYWRVAPHYRATDVTLEIHYLVSPDTPRGTQLAVAINGKVMGAITVHPDFPRGRFTVRLGRRAWGHGFYDIRIAQTLGPTPVSVATHLKPRNIWTQINYGASRLHYRLRFIPWRHLNFGELRTALAESSRGSTLRLRVGLYGPVTPALITASQEAVAGLALRSPAHLKVQVEKGRAWRLTSDGRPAVSVILGPASKLPAFASPARPMVGPTVLLIRNPTNPTDAVLAFTGTDTTQIRAAARAFARAKMGLLAGHEWTITRHRPVASTAWPPKGAAYPGERIGLEKLVGRSAPFGAVRAVIPIPFWMPGGQFASRQSHMKMWLIMATKPRTVPGHKPMITVTANHRWISEWKLTPGVARYQTTIPFSALVAGQNRVSFHISGGKAVIFPGSALKLPRTHRYAVLPNLALWQRTGFPLVVNGLGQHLSVWYGAGQAADWSAGLTLFARLVQASRSPLSDAVATFVMPTHGNVLAVGTLTSLDPRWIAASRLDAGGYLLESRAPYRHGIAVTLVANHTASLPAAAARLVSPENWQRLRGDLAWENGRGRYTSTSIGNHFVYGRRKTSWFWVFLFSIRPWLWIAAGSGAILFAALLVWIHTLRRRAQWRAEETL